MRFLIAFTLLLAPLYCSGAVILEDNSPRNLNLEAAQNEYFGRDFYCHHIIAVDEDGNGLLPIITRSKNNDGSYHYSAKYVPLAGEDVRGARVNSLQLREAARSGNFYGPKPFNSQMALALEGRTTLYNYLEAVFKSISEHHPKEVIVYVHGGLNSIEGAMEKSAFLADTLEAEESGKYFIGICWNSDLMPTYHQHLFSIREGLRQPTKAIITAPEMLLSDFGGAVVRLPLNLINFWYQDLYTVHPLGYKRTQLANLRYNQLDTAYRLQLTQLMATDPGESSDQTTATERHLNFLSWLATEPVKIPATLLLDGLATQPWKNMLRRTRTMFERESEFLPQLSFKDAQNLAAYQAHTPVDSIDPAELHKRAVKLLDQINSTGRTGAVFQFCDYAQQRLLSVGPKKPVITLVGHSMGAIVGCETVSRFHQLPLDNLVFEAAACSVSDFKREVVPYMEEQNLREKLWGDFKAQYGIKEPNPPFVQKTRFFNLCLHDAAENGEKNPGDLDLSQRGSLLTWIDTLYQNPESENDRTLGRWINAILSTDNLPQDILNRITIKEFGRNRKTDFYSDPPEYGYEKINGKTVLEPMKHGEFSRFEEGKSKQATNLEFWADRYREPEHTIPRQVSAKARVSRAKAAATSSPVPLQTEHKTIGGN